MRRVLTFGFLVSFIVVAIAFAASGNEKVARLSNVKGNLWVRDGANVLHKVTEERDILEKEVVKTGADGTGKLLLTDGSNVLLKYLSIIGIYRSKKELVAELERGGLVAEIASEKLRIECPHNSITGKGAIVTLSLLTGNELRIHCLKGKITVSNRFGPYAILVAGQKARIIFNEGELTFVIIADKRNKTPIKVADKEKKMSVKPGDSLQMKQDGRLYIFEVGVPRKFERFLVVPDSFFRDEPADEPYEHGGDLRHPPNISPSKP